MDEVGDVSNIISSMDEVADISNIISSIDEVDDGSHMLSSINDVDDVSNDISVTGMITSPDLVCVANIENEPTHSNTFDKNTHIKSV